MKLSISLAARKRPHLLVPTVRTTMNNIKNKDTRLVVMVDADDEAVILTRPQLERMGAEVVVQPRPMSFGEKFNTIISAAPADLYMMHVDYAPYITEGFDQRILEAAAMYPDGYAVVHNWYANMAFPSAQAVTHKLAEKMGGMYPPYYPYWFVDHHLDDVARMIDRVVFADVHCDTTARKEQPGKPWTTDKRDTWLWALLFDVLAVERREMAKSIIDSIDFDETPARKKVLINNFPWVAHRSLIINDPARKERGADIPSDAWYDAVKATGIAKLKSVLSEAQWKEVETLFERFAHKEAA